MQKEDVEISGVRVPVVRVDARAYMLSEAGPELKKQLDRIEEKLDRLLLKD